MGVITLMIISCILAVPVVAQCDSDQYQWLHQIYVDNTTGVNDKSCWKGGYSTPCLSLNLALKGAQHYNHSTIILLQPGQHQLYSGSETQLKNMSQLAIVGNSSEGEVVIKCQPLAGLAFLQSKKIELRNMTMIGCGAVQNSTSIYAKRYSLVYLKIQVATFFQACKDIYLTEVRVNESNGTGVVLYNPVGMVCVNSCHFMHNELSVEQTAGGGGLVIEANDITSQSSYVITNSNFTNNTASSGLFTFLSPTINPSSGYFGLGRGGGISVVFRGTATNNIIQLNNVRLEGNRAQFGAGLFLALYGNTSNNTVSIDGIEVMENRALETSLGTLLPSTSGGGALIELAATGPDYPSGNTINITSSRFISNAAEIGGGLTVSAVFDSGYFNADNKLLIENCHFGKNKAFQGSSVYLTQSGKSQQPVLDMTMSNSNFTNGHCGDTLTHGLPCSGSVLLRLFPLTLKGVSMFTENSISALSLRSTSIELLSSTQLQFINNSAVDGAALHIVDCSSLVVNSGTNLIFKENTASHRGGAIYSETCTFEQAGGRNCFIRHSNLTLHPDEWKINFTFTDNQAAGLGDSIYTDSIQSCIWTDQHSPSNGKLATFCWKGWSFSNNKEKCLSQLRSGPAYITGPTHYTLYPGECIDLKGFTVYDDWGNIITDEHWQIDVNLGAVQVINSTNTELMCHCNLPILADQCVSTTNSRPCESQSVLLMPDCSQNYTNHSSQISVHPPQFPGIAIDIKFKPCDNGTVCSTSEGCVLENVLQICNFYTSVCNGMSTAYDCSTYLKLNCFATIPAFYMCGRCVGHDYGIPINIPQFVCTKCKQDANGVAIFLFLENFPVLIMMIMLAVFHINITNGNLNGFILYSQLVTLQLPALGYSAWIPNGTINILFNANSFVISLLVYSIWNLNFLTVYPAPFCLPYINTAAKAILIQYVTATFPLLFIVVVYAWIHCYNNGYRFVVTTTRPVHQLLARFWQKCNIKPSLIDTYAGLILLSYMRFLAVSVKLLQLIAIDLQSSNEHLAENIALAVLAVLCLLVFVVLPMAVLLLYHFKIFQRCLTICKLDRPGLHALVDAYQGCFKNSATDGSERRYFAGIYLLFRFCFIAIVVPPLTYNIVTSYKQAVSNLILIITGAGLSLLMGGLVVILRPYKKSAHNVIDFLLLFIMIVISVVITLEYFIHYSLLYLYAKLSLLYVPFLVLLIFSMYRVLKYFCCACASRAKQCGMVIHYHDKGNTSLSEHKPLLKPVTMTEVVLDD